MTDDTVVVDINMDDFLEYHQLPMVKGSTYRAVNELCKWINKELPSYVDYKIWVDPKTLELVVKFYFRDAHEACFFKLKYG